ncbi:MAG: acetyl-CoA acetyltransferase, partial [Chloroflexi bacterium]|nr:acetyl-CoA acetyltransferase [Chloroflexota bacterium]
MGSIKGIRDKVAIIGMGCTKFGEHWDKSKNDLIYEATRDALIDAKMETKDIEAAWAGTWVSGFDGRCLADPLKLQYIPVTRVENACASGSDAFRNACYAVAAGAYDICLAVGFEKLKDSGWSGLPDQQSLPNNRYPDRTAPGMFALMATTYFSKYKLSPEEGKRMIGLISVKSHHNGTLNPRAHLRREVTIEQVMNAPIVAWPLGLFDCCGVSDGAAAAIVCRADVAKKYRPDPVYVKALQISVCPSEGEMRSDYDFTTVKATVRAGEAAYAEAGIKNPREEISMAELHDCFSITEAVTCEDLNFSPKGKVKKDIESGFFNLDGKLPVQPDGGLKSFGHPI